MFDFDEEDDLEKQDDGFTATVSLSSSLWEQMFASLTLGQESVAASENPSIVPVIPIVDNCNGRNSNNTSSAEEFCQICRGPVASGDEFALTNCKHVYCKDCLFLFVQCKICDGDVTPKCFAPITVTVLPSIDHASESFAVKIDEENNHQASATSTDMHSQEQKRDSNNNNNNNRVSMNKPKEKQCDKPFHRNDIVQLIEHDSSLLKKFEKFSFFQQHPHHGRECPNAACVQLQVVDTTSSSFPQVICSNCQESYCYYHSNAHPQQTCEDYTKTHEATDAINEKFIQQTSKPCPSCHKLITKSGGCNHMKCVCGAAFCWLCGKQIDDETFPKHFQWWNANGCSNLQMDAQIEPSLCCLVYARTMTISQLLLFGPITFISTLVSLIVISPCLVPHCFRLLKKSLTKSTTTTTTATATTLPTSPEEDVEIGTATTATTTTQYPNFNRRPPPPTTTTTTTPQEFSFSTLFTSCMTGWGFVYMSVVFLLPLLLLFGSVVVAVSIIVYLVYACQRLLSKQYPWPDSWTQHCVRRHQQQQRRQLHQRQLRQQRYEAAQRIVTAREQQQQQQAAAATTTTASTTSRYSMRYDDLNFNPATTTTVTTTTRRAGNGFFFPLISRLAVNVQDLPRSPAQITTTTTTTIDNNNNNGSSDKEEEESVENDVARYVLIEGIKITNSNRIVTTTTVRQLTHNNNNNNNNSDGEGDEEADTPATVVVADARARNVQTKVMDQLCGKFHEAYAKRTQRQQQQQQHVNIFVPPESDVKGESFGIEIGFVDVDVDADHE